MFKFINRTYIIGGTLLHIVWDKEKELGMINTYDLTVGINDKHNKAKSILNKWDVKLKSKLNDKFGYHNNFDIKVIANGKDPECIGCIYALRLMTQPPCSECKKSQLLYFTKENPMEWPEFKNCYSCKHRNKLVMYEPCRSCLSPDNDCTCWEFKGV